MALPVLIPRKYQGGNAVKTYIWLSKHKKYIRTTEKRIGVVGKVLISVILLNHLMNNVSLYVVCLEKWPLFPSIDDPLSPALPVFPLSPWLIPRNVSQFPVWPSYPSASPSSSVPVRYPMHESCDMPSFFPFQERIKVPGSFYAGVPLNRIVTALPPSLRTFSLLRLLEKWS